LYIEDFRVLLLSNTLLHKFRLDRKFTSDHDSNVLDKFPARSYKAFSFLNWFVQVEVTCLVVRFCKYDCALSNVFSSYASYYSHCIDWVHCSLLDEQNSDNITEQIANLLFKTSSLCYLRKFLAFNNWLEPLFCNFLEQC
jgi:hypothetical protein